MNQVRINVTRENIQQGQPFDFTKCPLGIALKQNFPYSKIWVDAWSFEIDGKKYNMPPNVAEFHYGFDTGNPVEPISFEIDL